MLPFQSEFRGGLRRRAATKLSAGSKCAWSGQALPYNVSVQWPPAPESFPVAGDVRHHGEVREVVRMSELDLTGAQWCKSGYNSANGVLR